MKVRLCVLCIALFSASLTLVAQAAPDSKSRTLTVHLNYTGAGTVDQSHKIFVVLWDSPAFVEPGNEDRPVDTQTATAKDGTVTFTNIEKVPAYVSAAYDPNGKWDAMSAPPEGSSLGMYGAEGGKPGPIDIKPAQTASIVLTFDDSFKMPKREKK